MGFWGGSFGGFGDGGMGDVGGRAGYGLGLAAFWDIGCCVFICLLFLEGKMSADGELNELMERIEKHIQVAEWCISDILENEGRLVEFSTLSMSNTLLAMALATIEMMKALQRIEEGLDISKGIMQDPGINREGSGEIEKVNVGRLGGDAATDEARMEGDLAEEGGPCECVCHDRWGPEESREAIEERWEEELPDLWWEMDPEELGWEPEGGSCEVDMSGGELGSDVDRLMGEVGI